MGEASGLQVVELGLADSYMPRLYSQLWREPIPGWRDQLDRATAKFSAAGPPTLFFRADEIGAAGQAFDALCRLFRHHQVPLAMAVVPAWLSAARQQRLFAAAPVDEHLWGWHQHGWRHVSRQKSGEKAEFGDDRSLDRQHGDLLQGRRKMDTIFGSHFVPIFTPPWNRFSAVTVKALRSLGYKGISTAGRLPAGVRLPWGFYNFSIGLDLHGGRSANPKGDFAVLMGRLSSLAGDSAGILVQHQRMTPFAFQFLDHLLYNLKHVVKAQFFNFREILNSSDEEKAGARLR